MIIYLSNCNCKQEVISSLPTPCWARFDVNLFLCHFINPTSTFAFTCRLYLLGSKLLSRSEPRHRIQNPLKSHVELGVLVAHWSHCTSSVMILVFGSLAVFILVDLFSCVLFCFLPPVCVCFPAHLCSISQSLPVFLCQFPIPPVSSMFLHYSLWFLVCPHICISHYLYFFFLDFPLSAFVACLGNLGNFGLCITSYHQSSSFVIFPSFQCVCFAFESIL